MSDSIINEWYKEQKIIRPELNIATYILERAIHAFENGVDLRSILPSTTNVKRLYHHLMY